MSFEQFLRLPRKFSSTNQVTFQMNTEKALSRLISTRGLHSRVLMTAGEPLDRATIDHLRESKCKKPYKTDFPTWSGKV